jgi:hypothetical protein
MRFVYRLACIGHDNARGYLLAFVMQLAHSDLAREGLDVDILHNVLIYDLFTNLYIAL